MHDSLPNWENINALCEAEFLHFMSIAWMYREDYDRAGYLALPRHRKCHFDYFCWTSHGVVEDPASRFEVVGRLV